MIDTKELRRLAQAATPGPWKILPLGDEVKCFAVADINFLSVLTVVDEGDTSFGAVYLDGDAEFIAAANPAGINDLLDRLESAEKDIALKERVIDSLGSELNAVANERDALRARIDKLNVQNSAMLKALLAIADWNSVWGPFPEKNEHWRAMAIVTAREATRAFEQGEQK